MPRTPPTRPTAPPPRQESLFAPPSPPDGGPPGPATPDKDARERQPPRARQRAARTATGDEATPVSRQGGSRPTADAPATRPARPAPAGTSRSARAGEAGTEKLVYTVSRLNQQVRRLLEGSYRAVWVEGEISNLSRPGSGHVYFTLKDVQAQVRCAMFRNRVRRDMALRDGLKVVVRGQLSLYENRGEYQILVDTLEETGEGALRRAFEALKRRLQAEGLFDPALKQPLPTVPHRIGVITSPTGAAVRDILHVLARRFPAVPVRIYPIPVQGAEAAPRIVRALGAASRRADCDVLILARGGGSLEDLWAFNEEQVARAIHACDIPVVSAVGHEVDFTIADFVADQRAPTPSAAAEMVVPDSSVWRRNLQAAERRLGEAARRRLRQGAERTRWLVGRLAQQHPATRLRQGAQRTDELHTRLTRTMRSRLQGAAMHLAHLQTRLGNCAPQRRLDQTKEALAALETRLIAACRRGQQALAGRIEQLTARLHEATPARRLPVLDAARRSLATRLDLAMANRLERSRTRLSTVSRTLEAVSPLATLGRGYAIVHRLDAADGADGQPGEIVRSSAQLRPGDRISARLKSGRLTARVEGVERAEDVDPGDG
jgi:exodeoxyribonuclease VII large subunit